MATLLFEMGEIRGVFSQKKKLWEVLETSEDLSFRVEGDKRIRTWTYAAMCGCIQKGTVDILDKDESIQGVIYPLNMNEVRKVGKIMPQSSFPKPQRAIFEPDENEDDIEEHSTIDLIESDAYMTDERKTKMKDMVNMSWKSRYE